MSAQPVPQTSRLEWFRHALRNDPAKLERFNREIAQADSTPSVPDDLDDIARLLGQST